MKKFFSVLICLLMFLNQVNIVIAAPEDEEQVFEVSSWSDFKGAFNYSNYQGETYTIKLMEDLYFDADDAPGYAKALIDVHVKGCFVTLDFNGHTLECIDIDSLTDTETVLSDFIRINLHPIDAWNPIEFRLTDSVGGGGVIMDSRRVYDNQLAALHVVDTLNYMSHGFYQVTQRSCKLTIDGGDYYLQAKTEKIGKGTVDENTYYRGTVIADAMAAVEINGGTFTAKSNGAFYDGDDFCARELSAFATCSNISEYKIGVESGTTVINGGTFRSDGYAIHHFDHSGSTDRTRWMSFPQINGGNFLGSVGYIGMSFTYENWDTTDYGMEEYREKPATDIINNDAVVRCETGGKMYHDLEGLTVGDLHEAESLLVISDSLYRFDTLPAVTGNTTEMERYEEQTDTFEILYDVPFYLKANEVTPYISVTPNGGTETTWPTTEKTIAYADYPNGLTVKAGVVIELNVETLKYENTYVITVTEEPKPAQILSQPQSCKVKPREYAEATVIADHAKAYQWYTYLEGYPIPLTDDLVAQLSGVKIEGYTTPTLRIAADSISKGEYYCVVTGTDDSTTKTDRVSFTFGGAPELLSFVGGEYYEGSDAEFTMYANYAEEITWYVVHRQSGSFDICTLDEFAQLTGCEYVTSHRGLGFYDELYKASVTFKNVPESWSGTYAVGYKLMNDLGEISFNPENTLPFTFSVTRPNIISFIETQSCIEGENMTFSFEAEDMSSAEWTFEKADDEGVMVAYTLDEIKALFPDTSFETSLAEGKATLTVSNVKSELCGYTLYANAISEEGGYSSAGMAQFNVISVFEYAITACEENYQKITVFCPEAGNYILYIAGYDENGVMKELHAKEISFSKGKSVYDTQKQISGYDKIKVMLWDKDMRPMCDFYQ